MKTSVKIFTLSKALKNTKSDLVSNLEFLPSDELKTQISTTSPAAVFFKSTEINFVLKTLKNKSITSTRLICVEADLNTDEMLALLNNDIEFISQEKFETMHLSDLQQHPSQETYNVLVVDDDLDQILLTEHILKEANLRVKSISKGEKVLEAINSFNPDLVLMDLYLNGITGDKLVKQIRKKEKYRFLPIVFLTSDASIESRMKVLNAGADDLLTKPIHSELLVSALKNRMHRQFLFHNKFQEKNVVSSNLKDTEHKKLSNFINSNSENKSASITWLKIDNKHNIQKKIGLSGFKSLCQTVFEKIPNFNQNFNIKLHVSEGIFAFASDNTNRNQAKIWVLKIKEWLVSNYFSIQQRDYAIEVVSLILANIPQKTNKLNLISHAENILIDNSAIKDINYVEEGIEEEKFNTIKALLEKAIKTRNFRWSYQAIVPTKDDSDEVYQLMLRVGIDTGKELLSVDYLEIANKTGLLQLLDRFTLEHAIRIIRAGELQDFTTKTLLNQVFSGYSSQSTRAKNIALVEKLNFPKNTLIFQFCQNDAQDHMKILKAVGKELKQARIKICLSNFDSSEIAWNIAKKLGVEWIRLVNTHNSNKVTSSINTAHKLGYKVIITKVDSANKAANLWKLNADYLQGNFIQAPIKEVLS